VSGTVLGSPDLVVPLRSGIGPLDQSARTQSLPRAKPVPITGSFQSGRLTRWVFGTRIKLNARFTDLDNHICFDPIRRLAALRANPSSAESAALYPLLLPAMSGACAISAVVDSSSDGLYVASTGDCRAVAGWQTDDGKWRCDVLTEDQMGDNPNEVAR
jgi:hypothetical protein